MRVCNTGTDTVCENVTKGPFNSEIVGFAVDTVEEINTDNDDDVEELAITMAKDGECDGDSFIVGDVVNVEVSVFEKLKITAVAFPVDELVTVPL